jgi:hypothetical protein
VEFSRKHPEVKVWQLHVTHPADDDGIWFFQLGNIEVQAESSNGNCPFLVESTQHAKRKASHNVAHLILTIEAELGLSSSPTKL